MNESKYPLLVHARQDATYDSILEDLGRFRGDFRRQISRAVMYGMIAVYPDGRWIAWGVKGRISLDRTVRLCIDREVG